MKSCEADLLEEVVAEVHHLCVGLDARVPEDLDVPLIEPPVPRVLRLVVPPDPAVGCELDRRLQALLRGDVPVIPTVRSKRSPMSRSALSLNGRSGRRPGCRSWPSGSIALEGPGSIELEVVGRATSSKARSYLEVRVELVGLDVAYPSRLGEVHPLGVTPAAAPDGAPPAPRGARSAGPPGSPPSRAYSRTRPVS